MTARRTLFPPDGKQKKTATVSGRRSDSSWDFALGVARHFPHVRRLEPLRALADVEGDRVAFVKGLEAFPLNGRVVNENVFALCLRDETKTL